MAWPILSRGGGLELGRDNKQERPGWLENSPNQLGGSARSNTPFSLPGQIDTQKEGGQRGTTAAFSTPRLKVQ